MKRSILLDIHPMYSVEFLKNEMKYTTIEEIVEHFKKEIEENPEGGFITLFDHYAHTKKMGGEILDTIVNAQNLLFCFGHTIKNIEILAFRPKSIAICELKDSFVFEFLETPRPEVNQWITSWIEALKK
jgi:hypothetical protein